MAAYWFFYIMILSSYYFCYYNPGFKNAIINLIMLGLIIFAGFRGIGVARDMTNYVSAFDSVYRYTDELNMEPAAKYIPVTLKYLDIYTPGVVFVIFAALGVSLKLHNLKKYSPEVMLSILMYYSYTFFLHEFTQIRAGVAIGIFLWSIQDVFDKNKYKFILKILFAMCFHISAVLFLFCYFFNTKKINKILYSFVVFLCLIVGFANVNLIKVIPFLSGISNKVDIYMLYGEAMQLDSRLNGVVDVFYIILVYLLIFFSDTIYQNDKHSILFTKLLILSISLHYLLTPVSLALGLRFFELFIIVVVICLLYLRYVFSQKYIAIMVCIIYSFYFLFLNTVRSPILESYHF